MLEKILGARRAVWDKTPLIHCITNPISINDCANYVLSAGAKPFMAEHPDEVRDITAMSDALALNIANITDARLCSIEISAKTADKNNIPSVIDVVGIGVSKLRYDYVLRLLDETHFSAIKGNIAEIRALLGLDTRTVGIDVAEKTRLEDNVRIVMQLAKKYRCTILASGENDIVSDGENLYAVSNGRREMSLVTGTGCVLNVLCAVYMSVGDALTGCVAAASVLGISGGLADASRGMASYRADMLDKFYTLTDERISENIRLKKLI
ncbi:MAG: hydroxyethylthiazole kinase [Firmicutes bacterium]|nr:hydroxyethylthiazole kinase [Bacillota bacterium]